MFSIQKENNKYIITKPVFINKDGIVSGKSHSNHMYKKHINKLLNSINSREHEKLKNAIFEHMSSTVSNNNKLKTTYIEYQEWIRKKQSKFDTFLSFNV